MPRRDKNAPSHPNRPFDYTNWSRIPEFKITAEAVLQFMDLIDHGSIQGLEDDDHLQYVHLSNPRIITASHRIRGKWFFESNQDLGGNRIENLGTPVFGSDAATKAYVDDIASTKTTYSDLWDNMIVTGVGLSIPSHGVVRVDHGVAYVGGRRVFVNGLDIVAAEHPNVTVTGVYVVYLDGYVKEGEALVAYPKVDHVANRPANRRENVIGLFSYVEGTGAVSNLTTGPALNAIPAPEGGHYRDPHTAKLYAYINEDLTERQVMYLADGSAFWPAKAGLDLGRDEEWGHRWNAIYGRTLHLLANAYVRGEVVEGGVALADKYAAIDHNHDGDYLPITGGTLQGSLTINGDLLADTLSDRSGYDLAHVEASEDPPGQVDAPQGTLWAYIGTPGSGGGVSQIQIEDADTPATAVSLISFQGNVLSVSGGIATLDLDSRYTQFGHNHDERYLKLTGGTLTGKLVAPEFEDTSGYDLAHVQVDESGPGSAEAPDGTFWAYVGTPGSGGGVSQIQFEDDDTPAGAASLLKFQGSVLSISGGIATLDLDSRYSQHGHRHAWGDLDNIPVYASRWPTPAEVGAAPEVHHHDERYLKLTGGTLTGKLIAPEFEDTSGYALAHIESAEDAPGQDDAPDGTLWAYVGTPGSGGGVSQIQVEDDDTPPSTVGLIAFQGSVLSVSGGIATLDLDSRYTQHGHNHDGRYLRLTGGTVAGGTTFDGSVVFRNHTYLGAGGSVNNRIRVNKVADGTRIYFTPWMDGSDQWDHELSFNFNTMRWEFDQAPYVGSNVIWHAGNFDPASKADVGHLHDDRYLQLTGGTLTGPLTATSFTDTSGYDLAHIQASEDGPGQASAPDGTLWAYVGAPGSGGTGQIQFEDDNTPAAAASLLKFQGDVLSVSGGIATLNLDGRYLRKDTSVTTVGSINLRVGSDAQRHINIYTDDSAGKYWHFVARSATYSNESRRHHFDLMYNNGGTWYNILAINPTTRVVNFHVTPTVGGIPVALSDHNHDNTYLKLTGGTLSGPLTAASFSDTSGFDLAHVRVDEDAPGMTNAPDGTLWAYVGSPGSGGGVGQIQFEDDNTAPSTASLLKFQGDVLSISGGVATLNLDGRYALVGHNHNGVYAPIAHNHDDRYALINHNHNGVYAPASHNHDDRYALVNHNHDGVYARVSQNQTISGLWTFRQGSAYPSLILGRDGFHSWGIGPSTSGGVHRFSIRNENTGAVWGFYDTGRLDGPGDGSVTVGGSLTVNGNLLDGNGHTVASVIVSGSSPSGSARDGTLWCIV